MAYTSLFHYFGKASTDKNLSNPQRAIMRDLLPYAISYANLDRSFPNVLVHNSYTMYMQHCLSAGRVLAKSVSQHHQAALQ